MLPRYNVQHDIELCQTSVTRWGCIQDNNTTARNRTLLEIDGNFSTFTGTDPRDRKTVERNVPYNVHVVS